MKRTRYTVFMLTLLTLASACRPARAPQASVRGLAVTNVTVIRVEDGARLEGQTVLIGTNRIARVAATHETRVPAGYERIDGRGAYLIPGLWDMHVHAVRSADPVVQRRIFGQFVANGVTGVRDMGSFPDTLVAVRRLMRDGALGVVPRLVAAGPLLDGDPLTDIANTRRIRAVIVNGRVAAR